MMIVGIGIDIVELKRIRKINIGRKDSPIEFYSI